jgi:endonuclease-3 related protein
MIVRALADSRVPQTQTRDALTPFGAVLAIALSRSGASAKTDAILKALDGAGLLQADVLAGMEPREVLDVLHDAGVTLPARSASVLKRLAGWFSSRFQDEDDALDETAWPTPRLRRELAALSGIGQATADAILLRGIGRPTYPVDRGTYRILIRHGWIDSSADYDEVSQLLTQVTNERHEEIERMSDWLTHVARQYCRSGSPQCSDCPLRPLLPEQGPLQPE